MSVPGEDVPELQLLEPDWLELELECERLRDLDRERLDPEFEPDSLPDLLNMTSHGKSDTVMYLQKKVPLSHLLLKRGKIIQIALYHTDINVIK